MRAHRRVQVPWRRFAYADDVALIALDGNATTVDFSAPIQSASGSVVTDADGTRQATVMFQQGTVATMKKPDGSTVPLTSVTFRATEYTAGAQGQAAMPAPLPPSSLYTYCVEYSVDEALAADATTVTFSKPVLSYVDNFLDLPVGTKVPAGYYDREKKAWIPATDGRVIKILSTAGGIATLDGDGDGNADDTAKLATLGLTVTDPERTELANKYAAGKTLWRVAVTHFTGWDWNWNVLFPPGALPTNTAKPNVRRKDCEGCGLSGSVIEVQNETLGEAIPIQGTPFTLNYRSDRVPSRDAARTIEIPLTGPTIPAPLQKVFVEVELAGVLSRASYSPATNLKHTLAWSGLDAYGRAVQGPQLATIRVGWAYKPFMAGAFGVAGGGQSFGGFSGAGLSIGRFARELLISWQTHEITVGAIGGLDFRGPGVGGWTLSPHHIYSPTAHMLYLGTGEQRDRSSIGNTVKSHHTPATAPSAMAASPDGSVYYVMGGNLYRISADAKTVTQVTFGALFCASNTLAVSPIDGHAYASGCGKVSRATLPGGVVSTVLNEDIGDISIGPDGTIYGQVQSGGCYSSIDIVRIRPDGTKTVTTLSGTNVTNMCSGQTRISPTGELFYSGRTVLRKMGTDGVTSLVAGISSTGAYVGDGVAANTAKLLDVLNYEVATDGSVLLADTYAIRKIDNQGVITTLAGTGAVGSVGNDAPAREVQLSYVKKLALTPPGDVWFNDNGTIRRMSSAFPAYSGGEVLIASDDGAEMFKFDKFGRHAQTLDAVTGLVRLSFGYTGGRLTSITDMNGNVTTIQRNAAGHPTAIVAPGGQTTTFVNNAAGYPTSVTDAAGRTTTLSYAGTGLLTGMTTPAGRVHEYVYDGAGGLVSDTSPAGFKQTLSRSYTAPTTTWTHSTSGGEVTKYLTEDLTNGGVKRTVIDPLLAQSVTTQPPGGIRTTTLPDGSSIVSEEGPDPRFGMKLPIMKRTVVSVPTLGSFTATSTRAMTLSNASDPFSVTLLTDAQNTNGRTLTTSWNVATKTVTTTSPGGRVATLLLDAKNRVVSAKADAAITSPILTTYDAFGRVSVVSQGPLSMTTTYDAAHRPTGIVDGLGRLTKLEYDETDLVTAQVTPAASRYEFAYDADGHRTQIKMPSGALHKFNYEADGKLATYTAPGAAPLGIGYDASRRANQVTLPDGRVIAMSFDGGGRLTGSSFPEGSTTRSYVGATGRLDTATRTPVVGAAQSVSFSYLGSVVTGMTYAGPTSGTIAFTYDAPSAGATNFWVTSRTLTVASPAASLPTTYTYDADGLRLTEGPFTFVRGGPSGRVTLVKLGATTHWTQTYDGLGRTATRNLDVGGARYTSSFTFDAGGRLTQKIEGVNGAASATYAYTYDLDGQLKQVTKNGTLVESYAYDPNGNRTSALVGAATETATYDAQDRLVARGAVPYTYDEAGFVTKIGTGATARTLVYSARGELLSATNGATGESVAFTYDAGGRRVARTDAGGTTQYFYDTGSFYVSHSRAPDGTLSEYAYDDAGRLYAMRRGGVNYLVGTDQVGTPKVIVTAAGAVVMQAEYDAWGQLLSGDPEAFDIPHGFAGGLRDRVTGLVRFGYRDYEPASGRWTAKDPIGFGGGFAMYAYGKNSPQRFVDREGLEIVPVGDPDEQQAIRDAIRRLRERSRTASAIICELERRPERVDVAVTRKGNEYYYHPRTGLRLVSFNPFLQSTGDRPWDSRPPEIGLAHEFIHALQDLRGNPAFGDLGENATRAIENQVRLEYGLPARRGTAAD